MAIDLELKNKRFEIKKQINDGLNKTPMALLLSTPNQVIQKITRSTKPLSMIACTTILTLTILMLLGINYLVLFRRTEATTQISLAGAIIILGVIFFTVAGTYFNINKVLVSIRDTLINFVESVKDLENLQQWLLFGWSPSIIKRFLLWWIVITGGSGVLFGFFIWPKGISAFGLLIPYLIFIFLGAIAFYYAPLMILLSLRLRDYEFILFESSPARSEVIEIISTTLNRYVYGYVIMNALLQLSLTTINLPIFAQIAFMTTFGWLPVIIQFWVNQVCIRNIVTLSKRKTLGRIQAEVQMLHTGDIKNKENLEIINRLMDYHKRIRVTPNTTVNLQGVGNFLTQLALPLLGFLLANLSDIIVFIRRFF